MLSYGIITFHPDGSGIISNASGFDKISFVDSKQNQIQPNFDLNSILRGDHDYSR